MSDKSQTIKINNRKAAHSQKPHVLTQKRHGSGKGGWGDPMDDLKFMGQDPSTNPNDPNYEPPQPKEDDTISAEIDQQESNKKLTESEYFQNFQSDVESLSAFKLKVEELVGDYFFKKEEEKFVVALSGLNCPNFYNQVPKVLLWTVISSKKQEHFPATRKLLSYLRSNNTISKIQLESAFRRLFHRLNELSEINSNAYIILVDFGEYCVARNLMEEDFLSQLKKQTEFAKDPQRIIRLKKHIDEIVAEFFSSGDIDEAIRCVSEMDTSFYNHEVVKRIISIAFDYGNRERELTSQFLGRAVGDNVYHENIINNVCFAIPRKNCELGFIILLQRVEGLYKDVPDVLELLSLFIGRAIVDEVLPPNFIDNQHYLLETDMGYTVINHVKHLLSGRGHNDQLLNCWGATSTKDISTMKKAIGAIIKEYLVSRELDEALTAIQELNIPMFHHEIIKQLIPAVADYISPNPSEGDNDNDNDDNICKLLNIPKQIQNKAIYIQLAIDLISTALQHNIITIEQISGGFKRLRQRMDDYKLDSPLINLYYSCIVNQFKHIFKKEEFENKNKQEEEKINTFYGGAKDIEINDEIREIVNKYKDLVIQFVVKNNISDGNNIINGQQYDIIKCKKQLVAGENYFIKICIGDGENDYIHVFIWKKLDNTCEILNVEINKEKDDELLFRIAMKPPIHKKKKEDKILKNIIVGGLKNRDINDELVIQSCKKIKENVILKSKELQTENKENNNCQFNEFTPIECKSQVVAGTNLFVKVRINENKFIHVRIWCKLDSTVELTNVQWNKNKNDQIEYF